MITFVMWTFKLSGGEKVIARYINNLVEKGHTVSVVVPENELSEDYTIKAHLIKIDVKSKFKYISLLKSIIVPSFNIPKSDIIFATYTPTIISVWFSSKILRKGKAYLFYQDYVEMFDTPLYAIGFKIALKLAKSFDKIITISKACYDELYSYTRRKAVIINPSIDDIFYPREIRKDEKYKTVLYVGDDRERKGYHDLLKALVLVTEDIHNIKLIFVTKKRFEFTLPIDVHFIYKPSDDTLAELYSTCDVFVFPSWYEGFGLPPLEAMACGAPVVVADSRGVREYALNGENCILVPIKCPEKLGHAIITILTDVELSNKLIENGQITAKAHRWESSFAKFVREL